MRFKSQLVVASILGTGVLCGGLHAAVINVPGDFPTVQEAINAAACGDEIVVAPGIYNEIIDFLGKAITVRSSGGPDVTTLDGTGWNDRVVKCISGEGPSSVLRGFTITNASGAPGGGMLNQDSSPTVSDCIFSGIDGPDGAGMMNVNSSARVENCTFTGNSVCCGTNRFGAAMANGSLDDGVYHVTIISCTFSDNTVSGGTWNRGAAMQNGGVNTTVTIRGCSFNGNVASEGGAISVPSPPNGNTIISCSSFCQNSPDDIFGPWTDGGGNRFGEVGVIDLLDVLARWGQCPAPAPCP